MSGVHEFVDSRSKYSQLSPVDGNPERSQGVGAWMNKLGIDRPLIAQKTGLDTEAERHHNSRQAVADRSRVSTPAFRPQKSGRDSGVSLQQPAAEFEAVLATRTVHNGRHTLQSRSYSESKAFGAFDTDTEKLDDTTELDSGDKSLNLFVKREGAPEKILHADAKHSQSSVFEGIRRPRSELSGRALVSVISDDYTDIYAGHDGDDESESPSEYGNPQLYDRDDSGNIRLEGAACLPDVDGSMKAAAAHRAHIVQGGDHPVFPTDSSSNLVKPEFTSQPQSYPHHGRSALTTSISVHDTKTENENAEPLKSPRQMKIPMGIGAICGEPSRRDAENPGIKNRRSPAGTIAMKRKYSPQFRDQKPTQYPMSPGVLSHVTSRSHSEQDDCNELPSSRMEPTIPNTKAEPSLDYEPETLARMSYQQLAEESFDVSPQPLHINDPSLTDASSLQEKLHHLHSLEGSQEEVLSQRYAFFSSLPIDQYEECGDLMAEEFSQIISKFKGARQQKRRLAKEFEDEIAAREKVVDRRRVTVANDLVRLKRAGQDVVRGT